MNQHFYLLCVGFSWDLLVGDPKSLWHPVCGVGSLITKYQVWLRKHFPPSKTGEQLAGVCLLLMVVGSSVGIFACLGLICQRLLGATISFWLEGIFCGVLLATRSLQVESMAVHKALAQGDLPQARQAVSMIVGRDTAHLTEQEVTKATVETVAENFCDGVLAPMCAFLLGGSVAMVAYKAVSTLDSMVGYQNQRYRYFGTASAKMDDVLNFFPARLGGLLLVLVSPLLGLQGKQALTVFLRDRKHHKSPNSAHTESAVAGALGVALGGNGIYGGTLVEKPTIGTATREIHLGDIPKTNQLMLLASLVFLLLVGAFLGLWW